MCGERGNIILQTLPPQSDTLGRVRKQTIHTRIHSVILQQLVSLFSGQSESQKSCPDQISNSEFFRIKIFLVLVKTGREYIIYLQLKISEKKGGKKNRPACRPRDGFCVIAPFVSYDITPQLQPIWRWKIRSARFTERFRSTGNKLTNNYTQGIIRNQP